MLVKPMKVFGMFSLVNVTEISIFIRFVQATHPKNCRHYVHYIILVLTFQSTKKNYEDRLAAKKEEFRKFERGAHCI